MNWNHYSDSLQEGAMEYLQLHLVCEGCGSSSTLDVAETNGVFGVHIRCMACGWEGYVDPTMNEGW